MYGLWLELRSVVFVFVEGRVNNEHVDKNRMTLCIIYA